jgi:RNA-splicing ligase RtcB
MIPYQGKYGKACVMLNELNDQNTISQIYGFLNHPAFANPISIMPDCHYGKGTVIGFTMEMTDMIIPNIVGVDINCGMLSLFLGPNALQKLSREEIDRQVRQKIPLSTNVHKDLTILNIVMHTDFWNRSSQFHAMFTTEYNKRYGTNYQSIEYNMKWLEKKCDQIKMNFERCLRSVGTLGGGNHFLELGKLVNRKEYLFTIHSGSRQFGLKICNYWQRKAGGKDLSYLTGDDMFGYLTDMIFAQQYAQANRDAMAVIVLGIFEMECNDMIETSHNFIDFRDFIIRKGAIRSYKGENVIIPFNMEDGLLICEGKSNPEWNYSAPHGAGRICSRSHIKKKMKQTSSQELIKERMKNKGIYTALVPLDETKEAYKDPKIIEEAIAPTAAIIDRAIPVLNIKAV